MAVPVLWRTKQQRYSLRGQVCPQCSQVVFPPRRLCPYCANLHAHEHSGASMQEYVLVMPHAAELRVAGDD
jgi:uncharacterized OB-fold protein